MLTESELEHLLAAARERNREHGVTGLLLYCDGNFMQYFEGPKVDVALIWEVIRRDCKHHDIVTLFDRTVPERLFADWTMAYRSTEPPDFAALLRGDWVTRCEGLPEECWFAPGVRLLHEFWRNNQTSMKSVPDLTPLRSGRAVIRFPPAAGK
jgi:hypothetical protein